ncbi:MAG: hypothetical protein WCH34_07115 [Bacteroidota bacterium]
MKKILSLLVVAGMMTFVACGPSQKEKDAAAKLKNDSIAAAQAEQAKQDSIAKAEEAMKAAEAAKQDSIAKAEEASKTKKVVGKKETKKETTKVTPKDKVKPGQGKNAK